MVENVPGKVIMGNVSTFAIENGTKESLKNISNSCLKSGVDILSPACGIGVRSKLDNIKVLVECAKQYNN